MRLGLCRNLSRLLTLQPQRDQTPTRQIDQQGRRPNPHKTDRIHPRMRIHAENRSRKRDHYCSRGAADGPDYHPGRTCKRHEERKEKQRKNRRHQQIGGLGRNRCDIARHVFHKGAAHYHDRTDSKSQQLRHPHMAALTLGSPSEAVEKIARDHRTDRVDPGVDTGHGRCKHRRHHHPR